MTSTHRTTALALGVVAGLAVLAGSAAASLPCKVNSCGENTAELRGLSILGLSLSGIPNQEGQRLVPGSVRFGYGNVFTCPHLYDTGYSLGVANGELVARAPAPGTAVVSGACLQNALFRIDVPFTSETGVRLSRVLDLKIAARNTVATWFTDSRLSYVPTYELMDVAKNVSICPLREAWMDSWQVTGLPHGGNPIGVGGLAWRLTTDHAFIVQGETYDDAAKVDATRRGSDWINIACAGSAIAKMRLLGYDPMSTWSTSAERVATLKMLTAHYVADSPTSFTVNGTPLYWRSARQVKGAPDMYYGMPEPTSVGPIEGMWLSDGMRCLSHLRVWLATSLHIAGQTEAGDLAWIRGMGGAPACEAQSLTDVYWRTYTISHID